MLISFQTGFVHQKLRDFVKITLTRVQFHRSQRDSSRARVTKNRDSSRVIDSSHKITAE